MPIGSNDRSLGAIGKFPSVIGNLIIDKILDTNGKEVTNLIIGNDVLVNYW